MDSTFFHTVEEVGRGFGFFFPHLFDVTDCGWKPYRISDASPVLHVILYGIDFCAEFMWISGGICVFSVLKWEHLMKDDLSDRSSIAGLLRLYCSRCSIAGLGVKDFETPWHVHQVTILPLIKCCVVANDILISASHAELFIEPFGIALSVLLRSTYHPQCVVASNILGGRPHHC